jgi:hypothetical protein
MRAFSQLRCTVRSEVPRISAISAKVKPQKNFRSTNWASSGCDGKLVERVTDTGELAIIDNAFRGVGGEGGDLETASLLLCAAIARVIDDETAHDPGGIAHESPAIRKQETSVAFGNVDIGLMEEGGYAETDGGSMTRQLPPGHAVELGVESREQGLGC